MTKYLLEAVEGVGGKYWWDLVFYDDETGEIERKSIKEKKNE